MRGELFTTMLAIFASSSHHEFWPLFQNIEKCSWTIGFRILLTLVWNSTRAFQLIYLSDNRCLMKIYKVIYCFVSVKMNIHLHLPTTNCAISHLLWRHRLKVNKYPWQHLKSGIFRGSSPVHVFPVYAQLVANHASKFTSFGRNRNWTSCNCIWGSRY